MKTSTQFSKRSLQTLFTVICTLAISTFFFGQIVKNYPLAKKNIPNKVIVNNDPLVKKAFRKRQGLQMPKQSKT